MLGCMQVLQLVQLDPSSSPSSLLQMSLPACFVHSPNFHCPSHMRGLWGEVPLSLMPRVTIESLWISTNLVCLLFYALSHTTCWGGMLTLPCHHCHRSCHFIVIISYHYCHCNAFYQSRPLLDQLASQINQLNGLCQIYSCCRC